LKFSYRQILASAGGAVLSAVIASIFGVKGTIVGVAIGSVAATTGTALLFQSIERTNQAVKQVVVRAPESSRLLRRLGGTRATGVTESEPAGASVLTEETATSAAQSEAAVTAVTAAAGEPAADQTEPVPATLGAPVAARSGLRWPVVAGVVAGVFVFSLLLVTGVELIAGRPLADLFGGHSKGTSVGGVFSPTTTLPPPTTTTTTSSTTTTTTSPSSTTTTTSVGGSTTTSTGPGTGSTSTTSPASTTTTSPGTSTSSTAVGARATPQVP
jgi:hypothetical protein